MSSKKPDNVVFNSEINKYDASLKPYPTNLGAPSIKIPDTNAWKNRNVANVNHQLKTRFDALKKEYEAMLETLEFNQKIFNSKFSFEPIVGQTYHLYLREDQTHFLSVLAPTECSFNYQGSYYLNAEQLWQKTTI
ncbi:GTP-binding protein Era [unidentified eubacterium SCB49]|nr:GTP-binding protein Era [unidentified eubacterium SCB49]